MPNSPSEISRRRKLLYASGCFGDGGWYQLMSVFLLFFYIDIVHLDPWLAALVFAISFGLWNAINDPIIGNLSDRTRTRFGRRRPWIAIGAPLALLFSILIWSPSLGGEPLGMLLYALVVIAAFEFAYTMCAVPYISLYPEMFMGVKERSEVAVYRQMFGVVGSVAAMVVFPILVISFSGAPLGITTTSLSDATIGEAYFENLQAAGGTLPYTWENIGSLPDNLILDNTGVISGTPTAENIFTFTVKVTDNASMTDSSELSIHVSGVVENFGIITENLPDGMVGKPYSATLQAAGGTPPYTWSVVGGSLPEGLSLSTEGVISGTSTFEQDATFTVEVTDAEGKTDTRWLIIHIASELKGGTLGGWAWAGGIIGVIFMGSYLIGGVLGGKERKEFTLVDKPLGFVESLKTAFTNKSLLTYVGAHVMSWCMFGWLSAMVPFFTIHVLKAGPMEMSMILGINMLGIFAFFVIWRKLIIRLGPRWTLFASAITFTLSMALVLVIRNVPEAMVMGFLTGATIGGIVISRGVIYGDIIDEDEIKTGVRREGALLGVIVALEKLSIVVIAACTAFLLSTIIGYVPGQPAPAFMGMGIRLGMFGFMVIFLVIALVSLKFYPLTKEKTEEIGKKLEKLHAEKTKKLEKITKKEKGKI